MYLVIIFMGIDTALIENTGVENPLARHESIGGINKANRHAQDD